MFQRKQILGALAVLTAGVALAHHIPKALSYTIGHEILSEVHAFLTPGQSGVPAYVVARDEHDHVVSLADGDSFKVVDAGGNSQTVVFRTSMFADIANASDHEVVDAVMSQLTNAEFFSQNGFFGVRGLTPGATQTLELVDGTTGTLGKLNFSPTTATGADDLVLDLSIPLGDVGQSGAGLEGHSYRLLVSQTDAQLPFGGSTLPIGLDRTTRLFLRAANSGALPGFIGRLDDNADAQATLPLDLVETILGGPAPSELFLSYVVYAPNGSGVEYISNRFTIHLHP